MKTSYEVIITGDRVTWIGDRPSDATAVRGRFEVEAEGDPLPSAAVPPPLPPPTDGRVLAALMRDIAEKTGGIASIPDPIVWQREQREDRPMPAK